MEASKKRPVGSLIASAWKEALLIPEASEPRQTCFPVLCPNPPGRARWALASAPRWDCSRGPCWPPCCRYEYTSLKERGFERLAFSDYHSKFGHKREEIANFGEKVVQSSSGFWVWVYTKTNLRSFYSFCPADVLETTQVARPQVKPTPLPPLPGHNKRTAHPDCCAPPKATAF